MRFAPLCFLVTAGWAGAAHAADAPRRLTLDEARQAALGNHPAVASAQYRADAQNEVFKQARAGLLPQVSLYGNAVHAGAADTRIMAGGLNNPSIYDRTAFGGSLSQLITDFGRTSNLAASARFQSEAEQQNAVATRQQVVLDVERNYFAVLQAQALQGVARQTIETRQLLLDRISVLASNKLKSELDVNFTQVSLEDAKLLQQRADTDRAAAMAALSASMGLPETREFALDEASATASEDLPDNLEALTRLALERRPELAGLRDSRESAERLARSMRDARLPALSAVVAGGLSPHHDDRLPNDYAAGGIQVSVPVFAGGYYSARQHEAEFRAKSANEAVRAEEDAIARDVSVAWLNLRNARERLRTSSQLARYANDAYQLAEARYRAGSSSIVELSQAQLQLTSAQIAETTARYDVLMQGAILRYQAGSSIDSSGGQR